MPSSFFHLLALMEKERLAALAVLGTDDDAEALQYQGRAINIHVSEGVLHEVSHAIFSSLEEKMALSIDMAGFPRRIDLRPPEKSGEGAADDPYDTELRDVTQEKDK